MALPSFPFWIDDKYKATSSLGKGGAGFALLAQKGDQQFAIKLLNLTLVKTPEKAVERFKKEFLILKKLNHPFIGKIFDFGFDTNLQLYYFVAEHIEGKDLLSFCKSASIEQIEKLFVQILQALQYLHTFSRAGLRHNDIKTANILVTQTEEGPQVKLIDFGMSAFVSTQIKGGTASYMAPEQIKASFPQFFPNEIYPPPDHRSDLYALGVAWYFCLTGVSPFQIVGDTQATLKRHFDFFPKPPSQFRPEIPDYLDKIILKLLKTDPKERYANAAEVIQDLRYLSKKPYSVIPISMRRHFLPEGEWVGMQSIWQTLKQYVDPCLKGESLKANTLWIIGERGQGKTKLLKTLKDYIQSQEGKILLLFNDSKEIVEEWAKDLSRQTKEIKKPLIIGVDNYSSKHPAQKYLSEIEQKIQYAKKWQPDQPFPWLLIYSSEQKPVEENADLLSLRNYTFEEVKELMKKISPFKNEEPPQSFIQALYQQTNGNPLFVQSVLKTLGEKELLWNDDGAWHPSLFQSIDIDFKKLIPPQDIEVFLEKNWRALNPIQQKILKHLSCFQNGALEEELFTLLPSANTDELEKFFKQEILIHDDKRHLIFKSAFFQRKIYEKIKIKEKEKLHQAIAKAFKTLGKPPHLIHYHLAKVSNKTTRQKALEQLAEFYEKTGKLEEAYDAYQELVNLTPKNKQTEKFQIVTKVLHLLLQLRNSKEGIQWIAKWMPQLPKRPANSIWTLRFLEAKGLFFLLENKIAEARSCFEKALLHLKESKSHSKEKIILQNRIAKTWLDERKIETAVQIYEQTRIEAKKLPSQEAQKIDNNDLGYCLLLTQEANSAIQYLEEDLKQFEALKDPSKILRCHYLLGGAFRKLLRNFSLAIKHYQESANLASNLKDNDWLMRSLNGIAATYLDSAHTSGGPTAYAQALRYFEQSLALCHHLKKEFNELDFETAALYLNIGTLHQELGNFAKAFDAFQTIVTVLEGKPNKQAKEWSRLCETQIAMADCLAAQKKYKEMEMALKKAWAIAHNSKSLLEAQLVIQILWAEKNDALHNPKEMQKHLSLAKTLQEQYQIHPTPLAQKKLEKLEKSLHDFAP